MQSLQNTQESSEILALQAQTSDSDIYKQIDYIEHSTATDQVKLLAIRIVIERWEEQNDTQQAFI